MRRRFFILIAFIIMMFCTNTANAAETRTPKQLPYVIEDNAVYYESSWNFGSGRQGIVNKNNQYVTKPCYAGINGYSFLDKEGNIIISDYKESTNDIAVPEAPSGAVKLFYHFKSTYHRNGWVSSNKVKFLTKKEITSKPDKSEEPEDLKEPDELEEPKEPEKPKKQNSKELADMINNYGGITVVIVDRSSSMDDFADKATKEFRKLHIDSETTKVYVFGRYFKEIKAKDITNDNSDVRKNEKTYDYLADVINDAAKYKPDHIILLTDLGVYDGSFVEQTQLKTLDILLPFNWEHRPFTKKRIENIRDSFPATTLNIRQFDE